MKYVNYDVIFCDYPLCTGRILESRSYYNNNNNNNNNNNKL